MEPNSRTARYVTLRDYLRVLRRYRVAIVLIALIGTAAGLYDAKRQKPVYQATASVALQDPAQDLTLVGLGSTNVQAPGTLALESSETITRPGVITQVQRQLRTTLPTGALSAAISSQVSTAGLLDITGSSSSPPFAAQLANAVAQVLVRQNNQQTQASFAAVVRDARRQIANQGAGSRSPAANPQLAFLEDELVRLNTLKKLDHTAQIAQFAQPPTSPVSPKTLRSAILGLLLGLLLAVALAYLRDSMDRRLRNAKDVEANYHFPILGHVRNQVMGRIAYTASTANDDYKADLEAFRIVRRNIEFLNIDSPPRSIVVTSAVPEEGKTTVAGSLAFAMASAGKRTLLVDCDLRRPALATRLEIAPAPGISDFLAGEATPEQILQTVGFSEAPSLDATSTNGSSPSVTNGSGTPHNLVCIPAGSPTSHAAELLGSSRFKQFLEQVVEVYDVVVIDSSPLLPVADTLEILPHVQGVVLCARELQTTREEALAAKTALSRFPDRPTGVVVTGVKPHGDDSELYAYSYSYS